jgi:hypothetical protein
MSKVTTRTVAEEWRAVPGFSHYEVSSHGQLRSYRQKRLAPRILRPSASNCGHLRQTLMRDGERVSMLVHRLVLLAFVGPCPEGQEVRHLDGDPTNNRLDNLVYGSRSENIRDRYRHGLCPERKTECPKGHPYDAANTYWDPSGYQACKTCRRANRRAYRARAAAVAA